MSERDRRIERLLQGLRDERETRKVAEIKDSFAVVVRALVLGTTATLIAIAVAVGVVIAVFVRH